MRDTGVKILTVHGAKGLQFKVVGLLWADLLPRCFPDNTEAESRGLLYVAMTRAEDVLVKLHSGLSPFVSEVAANIAEAQAVGTEPD